MKQWLATAKDPRFHQPYTALVYQPMLEVMDYLRANGFKTYIVTGGGQEFVRVYSQSVYGVPPEQVVGSSILTKYEYRDGKPVLMREPKVFFIDDKAGKPVGINLFIGKRPCAAFGNSTGDQQMLEWTQAGDGARLMMLVLHDDPEREYAYGPAAGLPDSKVGTFSQALYDEAKSKGWTVISMKKDWKRIFAFAKWGGDATAVRSAFISCFGTDRAQGIEFQRTIESSFSGQRSTVMIRRGKGNKDRMIPLGERGAPPLLSLRD